MSMLLDALKKSALKKKQQEEAAKNAAENAEQADTDPTNKKAANDTADEEKKAEEVATEDDEAAEQEFLNELVQKKIQGKVGNQEKTAEDTGITNNAEAKTDYPLDSSLETTDLGMPSQDDVPADENGPHATASTPAPLDLSLSDIDNDSSLTQPANDAGSQVSEDTVATDNGLSLTDMEAVNDSGNSGAIDFEEPPESAAPKEEMGQKSKEFNEPLQRNEQNAEPPTSSLTLEIESHNEKSTKEESSEVKKPVAQPSSQPVAEKKPTTMSSEQDKKSFQPTQELLNSTRSQSEFKLKKKENEKPQAYNAGDLAELIKTNLAMGTRKRRRSIALYIFFTLCVVAAVIIYGLEREDELYAYESMLKANPILNQSPPFDKPLEKDPAFRTVLDRAKSGVPTTIGGSAKTGIIQGQSGKSPVNSTDTENTNSVPANVSADVETKIEVSAKNGETKKVTRTVDKQAAPKASASSPVNSERSRPKATAEKTKEAKPVTPPRTTQSRSEQKVQIKKPVVKTVRKPRQVVFTELLQSAYAAFQSQDYERAKELYSQVLSYDERHRDSLLGLAATENALGNESRAFQLYQQHLAQNPNDSYAIAGVISLINNRSNAPALLADIQEEIIKAPNKHHLHYLKGVMLSKLTRWPEAQQAFFQAWSLNSADPNYAFNLAVALDQIGESGTALTYYLKAVAPETLNRIQFSLPAAQERINYLKDETEP